MIVKVVFATFSLADFLLFSYPTFLTTIFARHDIEIKYSNWAFV